MTEGAAIAAAAKIATSLPGCCLGAIEDCEGILGDLDEEDKENLFSGKSLKISGKEVNISKIS